MPQSKVKTVQMTLMSKCQKEIHTIINYFCFNTFILAYLNVEKLQEEFQEILNAMSLIGKVLNKCDQFINPITLILYPSSCYLQFFVMRRPTLTLRMSSSRRCSLVTASGRGPCRTSLTWSSSSLDCP